MNRFMFLTLVVIGALAIGAAPAVAQEEIKIVDHQTKKESTVKGTIDSESPEGIKLKVGNETKLIPAADVKYVLYKLPAEVKGYEYSAPFTKESKAADAKDGPARLKLLGEAKADFETVLAKAGGSPNIQRFFQFKIAQVVAQMSKDDAAQIEPAIKLLQTYKVEQDKGWELVPAMKLLAQLQEGKGDVAEARQTYLDLAKIPNLPQENKQEFDLLVGQLSLRTGKLDEAATVLERLRTGMAAADPQRSVVLVYLAQCQLLQNKMNDVEANLSAALSGTSEPAVKCLAHNTLGDYYRKKNQNEEAFWEYLRVDALYPQDRNEHAKALYYLWKLFDEVKKDKVKSTEYLEKLKLLDGTEYARLATMK
jgi:hypothetical protein